jgi:thymidylate synthase (FAD)
MRKKVLSGYVDLKGVLGDELTVVNAARQSFDAHESFYKKEHREFLQKLIDRKEYHPFRHVLLTFEMKAPFIVMRQIQRYVIGTAQPDTMSAWSEMSLRYMKKVDKERFYIPKAASWRQAAGKAKDGSSAECLHFEEGLELSGDLSDFIDLSLDLYEKALNKNVAPEMARLFLPVNTLYITWTMTISLQALFHMLEERLSPHAMEETRLYAEVLEYFLHENLPELHTVWLERKK